MTPLSEMWVIEYHFHADCFSIEKLSRHLQNIQNLFAKGRFHGSQILAIHPNRKACEDECELWQQRWDKFPLPAEIRTEEFLRYISEPLPQNLEKAAQISALQREPLNR